MKKNKKLVMGLSFCLGLFLFVTTAFADIAAKSGYEQLKDSIKFTAESCSEKFQSFTEKSTITLKDNDKVLISTETTEKYDNKNSARESRSSTTFTDGKKQSSYSYNDSKYDIWYNSDRNTYYVNEYPEKRKEKVFNNPFKEESVEDIEKIIDAVVGGLKDYVIVDDKTDGSKEFSGSLSEGQVPTLINAVTSFAFKKFTEDQSNVNNEMTIPAINNDLFVKNVKGKAAVNKDGIIESIYATIVISGKDKKGELHELTLEVLTKVFDINATSVSKPNLEGQKIEKNLVSRSPDMEITTKFVGKYRNDIVIEKDGKYEKIGERFVEITQVDGNNVAGRYYEQYKKEYSQYGNNNFNFAFSLEDPDRSYTEFEYTTSSGDEGRCSMSFDHGLGKIYFSMHNYTNIPEITVFDSSFSRVFEE
jgi:hypothetical protein